MAVRVLTYTIDENSMSSSSIAQGGVQGEHNATQIEFVISPLFANKLSNLNKDGLTFCYRFDRYDGVGGMKSTDPIAFVPGKDNKFTHLIENWQTRDGGTIQVYFVITLIDNEATEMELFTYNVKLMLKSKPNAKETDRENYESISTLAMIVKNNTDIVLDATSRAVDACGRTENARMALEGGTEWIFDGGDASGNVDMDGDGVADLNTADIKFVIDTTLSENSENAIENKTVAKEIKAINEHLTGIDVDLSKKELASNKVDKITEDNDNSQYPSALAVYKYGLRPIMTVGLKEEAVFGEGIIPLNQIRGQLDCDGKYLISENGTIKIGEGVNKVLISGQMFAQMENPTLYLWGAIHLFKSDGSETQISVALDSTTLDYASVIFSPVVVDVKSGDCFLIKKYSSTKDIIRNAPNTYMTVQVINID